MPEMGYSQDSGNQDAAQPGMLPPTTQTSQASSVLKSNLETNFALGPRIGNFIWMGQVTNPLSNYNGIRGNFIFNGPTIPAIGFGVRIGFTKLIRLAPSIDFTFDDYVYRADLNKAFPTQSMTGNAVGPVATVIGFMISIPVWFDISLTERLILSLAPGICIYPRVAMLAVDNSTGIDAITNYLNGDLRWFYPQTGISIKYTFDQSTSVGLELQLLYPIWHLVAADNLSFFDGMILTGFFGLDFYL